jgi:hypothetical protein
VVAIGCSLRIWSGDQDVLGMIFSYLVLS